MPQRRNIVAFIPASGAIAGVAASRSLAASIAGLSSCTLQTPCNDIILSRTFIGGRLCSFKPAIQFRRTREAVTMEAVAATAALEDVNSTKTTASSSKGDTRRGMTLTKPLGEEVRGDFAILKEEINGHPLVYLDNAATSQKPKEVIEAIDRYYQHDNANVHRGVHTLSSRATDAYEGARVKIADLINAESPSEIIYTRNATEAINVVAYAWGITTLQAGDEIVLSVLEHHSNLIPWQIVAQRTGAVIKYAKLTEQHTLDLTDLEELVTEKTKLVATAHVSNALGCIADVKRITQIAHSKGAKVLIDACQSVPHMEVDVQDIGCDWLVFSSHKMCGPTGLGILYGKKDVLEGMPPFMGGGEMIQDVYLDHFTCNTIPHKFEAGTPAIAEAVGLGAAIDYLNSIGMDRIHSYEWELTLYLWEQMQALPYSISFYGPKPSECGPEGRAPLATFNVDGIHPNDLCFMLDQSGVAIRAGHHCTQPLHRQLGISGSARASLHFYNTKADIDRFIEALKEAIEFFNGA